MQEKVIFKAQKDLEFINTYALLDSLTSYFSFDRMNSYIICGQKYVDTRTIKPICDFVINAGLISFRSHSSDFPEWGSRDLCPCSHKCFSEVGTDVAWVGAHCISQFATDVEWVGSSVH